jgi:hypothetical protein
VDPDPDKEIKIKLQLKHFFIFCDKNTQRFKTRSFLTFFLFLWVTLALLDPDPAEQNQCWIHAEPDPQH